MSSLVYAEMLKMKGSKMFLVSLLGGIVSPLLTLFMLLGYHDNHPDEMLSFEDFFHQTHLFITFLVGILLFSLIATYIFNREFEEDTLKNTLTIPVSRSNVIFSKIIVLFLWIEIIMLFSYLTVITLGSMAGFRGLQQSLFVYLQIYLITGFLLYLLTPIIIFITLLYKSYMLSIALSIFVTLGTMLLLNSEYSAFYPWSIPAVITMDNIQTEYPSIYSWIIIVTIFFFSLGANLVYFNKTDIH